MSVSRPARTARDRAALVLTAVTVLVAIAVVSAIPVVIAGCVAAVLVLACSMVVPTRISRY
jgi:hypothetical protein